MFQKKSQELQSYSVFGIFADIYNIRELDV